MLPFPEWTTAETASNARGSLSTMANASETKDPNTLSNYEDFATRSTHVSFMVDFHLKRLYGSVRLTLESLTEAKSHQLILDTYCLDIDNVQVNNEAAAWEVGPRLEPYGSPLMIALRQGISLGNQVEVDVHLSTTDECTALQWLTPEQAGSDKKYPYVFSQCQAIHARSLFPCQDTPAIKSTYYFCITSPLKVITSGLPLEKGLSPSADSVDPDASVYHFVQEIPIPSYLFAIASGDIEVTSIGPRSNVATGPDELQDCKWELEQDTEKFIEAAERIIFPYPWKEYNVLVLPSSFPYGGMENPIYTFATPTIISGDRQNVDVIAHELSHSWSGNLVSNVSWEHFWLNEGWTIYLERRIIAELHGEAHRHFSAIIGWKGLEDSVELFGKDHEFTKLVPNLRGKDPDDAFSQVPYEKGSTFLWYIEKLVGRVKWDQFIPYYFRTFERRSLNSYDFKSTLLAFFSEDAEIYAKLIDLEWDQWFFAPGLPPKPDFDTSLVDVCLKLASKWKARDVQPKLSDIQDWSSNQTVVFLERIQEFDEPLDPRKVKLMGNAYGFDKSQNVEIASRYFQVGLRSRDDAVIQPTVDLLGKVGRMKFVRPL